MGIKTRKKASMTANEITEVVTLVRDSWVSFFRAADKLSNVLPKDEIRKFHKQADALLWRFYDLESLPFRFLSGEEADRMLTAMDKLRLQIHAEESRL